MYLLLLLCDFCAAAQVFRVPVKTAKFIRFVNFDLPQNGDNYSIGLAVNRALTFVEVETRRGIVKQPVT
jgi:hypothetical protein